MNRTLARGQERALERAQAPLALRLKRFLFDYRRWIWLPLLLMILWTLLPIMWILISSVSPRAELYSIPPHWIPDNFTLNAYEKTLISGEGFRGGRGHKRC